MKKNLNKINNANIKFANYIKAVRTNIDCPKIYFPFIENNNEIDFCSNEWVQNPYGETVISIKPKFVEGISNEEKRNKLKEAINLFIDIALDEYELYKEEAGINKIAKVDRSKEVRDAKERLEKYKELIKKGKDSYNRYFTYKEKKKWGL